AVGWGWAGGLPGYRCRAGRVRAGGGAPIPPNTAILESVGAVARHKWEFPIIVQPGQEHGGVGLDRFSVVESKKALRDRVREILRTYRQPALAQRFLPGREFNVGIGRGHPLRVL